MDTYEEMRKNAADLKLCNKTFDRICIVYAFACLLYAAFTVCDLLFALNGDFFSIVLEVITGVILKIGIFSFGYLSCYRHNNFYAGAAAIIAAVNIFVGASSFGFDLVLAPAVCALAIVTCIMNKKYAYLEQQYGFPHFSELLDEQRLKKVQHDIKDDYTAAYERRKATSSSEMTDFSDVQATNDSGENTGSGKFEMEDVI